MINISIPESTLSNFQLTKYTEGGMGELYFYEDFKTAQKLILKALKNEHKKRFSLTFLQEIFVNCLIEHPNIVKLNKLLWLEDNYYIGFEYISGLNLFDLMKIIKSKNIKLPISIINYILYSVLSAIEYLQNISLNKTGISIIHKDLSPHNIMISAFGDIKLIDFGASTILGLDNHFDNAKFGKPYYMSPLYYNENIIDKSTDIFSLGIVYLELLLGRGYVEFLTNNNLFSIENYSFLKKQISSIPQITKESKKLLLKMLNTEKNYDAIRIKNFLKSYNIPIAEKEVLKAFLKEFNLISDYKRHKKTALKTAVLHKKQ